MKKLKYELGEYIEKLEVKKTDWSKYETSFKRWLVSEIELGNMTILDVAKRYDFDYRKFKDIFRTWQQKYSSKIHLSLKTMTPEELTDFKKLQERIKELEEQLEKAQIKYVLTQTMIDIAEEQLKIDIRKKHGPKQ